MRASLLILAPTKPKINTNTATEVRLVSATELESTMYSFEYERKYTRNSFQVSNCWYSNAMASEISREWTFLSNHGHVLVHLSRYPDSRIRDIADTVGITERSAQAILADLEESGYVTITRIGRRNSYKVNTGLKFRHPSEASKPISSLLKIFS